MSAARPVVATNVDGAPEAIHHGQNGLLYYPNDRVGMTKGVLELLADKPRRLAMGKEGRRFVKANFDMGVLGDTLEKLYRSVLTEG